MNEIREQIAYARDHLNDYLRNETELRGSVMHGAFDTMEKMLAVVELVARRSHFCSGRDCIGFMAGHSATQYRCHMCEAMLPALTALVLEEPDQK